MTLSSHPYFFTAILLLAISRAAAAQSRDRAGPCQVLAESQHRTPDKRTLAKLLDCYEANDRLADALDVARELLGLLPTTHKYYADVKSKVDALEKRVPRLTIKLADDAPEDTVVKLDGSEVEVDTELREDPGDHEIVVRLPGGNDCPALPVTLTEGEAREVPAKLCADAKRSGAATAGEVGIGLSRRPDDRDEPSTGSTQRWVGWGVVGFGAVAGIGAVVAYTQVIDHRNAENDAVDAANSAIDAKKARPPGVDPKPYDDYISQKDAAASEEKTLTGTATLWAIVSGGVAVVAVGTGLTLALTAKPSDSQAHPSALRVSPIIGTDLAACAVEGTW